jgi:hypothetical protein
MSNTHFDRAKHTHTGKEHAQKRTEQTSLRPDRATAGELKKRKKDEPGLTSQPSNQNHLAATRQTQ